MSILRFACRTSPRVVVGAAVCGTLSGIIGTLLLALVTFALSNPGAAHHVWWVFAAGCLAMPVSRIASEGLLLRLAQDAVMGLRVDLCRRWLSAPLRAVEQTGTPRMFSSITDDVATIAGGLATVPVTCTHVGLVVSGLAYLGYRSPQGLTILFGVLALGITIYLLCFYAGMAHLKSARHTQDHLFTHLRALTEGVKDLKMHASRRAAFWDRIFRPTLVEHRRSNVKAMLLFTMGASWGHVLLFVYLGSVLFVPAMRQMLDPSSLTTYVVTLLYILTPMQGILNALPMLSRANVALARVNALEADLPEPVDASASPSGPAGPWRTLSFCGVTHSYQTDGPERAFELGPVDLTFQAHEIVFVVGGNGSGKTTFAKLLAGLYAPERGHLCVDGQRVTDLNREQYRQWFSAVFSDYFLFDDLLGLVDAGREVGARSHLARLHLDHCVDIQNGALTRTNLSNGQRRRLALLVTLLEDRPVCIFDEWAADQDPYFRELFYTCILPELKQRGKTLVVITHDDHYYHLADRLLKFEAGRVVSDEALRQEPRSRAAVLHA